ncbi:MAG TPA: hypothetical protein VKZ53_15480 [Candidatus Angelobacter sp.]|nr:hypothetical protein [Candidatus Angelobacter sp.]
MVRSKRIDRRPREARTGIPTESDWGDYQADLDQKWAHDQYCGRSNAERQDYLRNSPIEAASDLRFMPEIPFRYYVLGYRDLVMSGNLEDLDRADAASCFLGLVANKLEKQPRYIVPVMPHLLPAIEHVARHQAEFGADESIYGSFSEMLARIHSLYAEVRDRYSNYP